MARHWKSIALCYGKRKLSLNSKKLKRLQTAWSLKRLANVEMSVRISGVGKACGSNLGSHSLQQVFNRFVINWLDQMKVDTRNLRLLPVRFQAPPCQGNHNNFFTP